MTIAVEPDHVELAEAFDETLAKMNVRAAARIALNADQLEFVDLVRHMG